MRGGQGRKGRIALCSAGSMQATWARVGARGRGWDGWCQVLGRAARACACQGMDALSMDIVPRHAFTSTLDMQQPVDNINISCLWRVHPV
jgi:hypothetical protein